LVAAQADILEEVQVYGIKLGSTTGQVLAKLPYAVQRADAMKLERSQSLDISEFTSHTLTSVSINSAQNSPL